MAVVSTADRSDAGVSTGRLAVAVADANWFSTENLFAEVSPDRAATLMLRCIDYTNAWRRGEPPWAWGRPLAAAGPGRWGRDHVLPPGWMKQFPRLGMRPIARSIRRWRSDHAPDGPLVLVMTYPHYLHLRDQVRPDRQVYYNVDDYAMYWPRQAEEVRRLERRAVREADLTVCVSRQRADELRRAVPEASAKILHLPHGTPSAALPARPLDRPAPAPRAIAGLRRPILGYVGSLEDRVDWPLLARVAAAFPAATIVLVGRIGRGRDSSSAWRSDRARCLAMANVQRVGWQPQAAVHGYYRAFDATLIPYRVDHPFNRACSPTKIMDAMATGRPIVSTALPECLLYRHLFDVADSADAFVGAVGRILAAGSDDGLAGARHGWAVANTCRRVVERLLDSLPG